VSVNLITRNLPVRRASRSTTTERDRTEDQTTDDVRLS
jgi:hypothetical protein